MNVLSQFDPLVIEEVREANFSCSRHSHTYYELVYIGEGTGNHLLNDHVISYRNGDLFLVAPGELHSFEIHSETHFIYIKFTEGYFESKRHLAPDEFKVGSPELLMEMKWLKEVKIVLNEPCNHILRSTIENLLLYSRYHVVSSSPIAYYQLLSIFGMIKEILRDRNSAMHKEELNYEKLISYIHEHIYSREKLLIRNLAEHFNIAPSYFSNYFKRHFGSSYQLYLDSYRIALVEKRLRVGGLKTKQIAEEFGFTDVSHLSKIFKKIKGVTPKAYVDALSQKLADC